jgi:hypothetical protein
MEERTHQIIQKLALQLQLRQIALQNYNGPICSDSDNELMRGSFDDATSDLLR